RRGGRLPWPRALGRWWGRGRGRGLSPELVDRLREDQALRRGLGGGRGGADVVPAAQEEDDLAIFLAGQIGLVAHVRDCDLVVAEGALAQRACVVARAAIELEQPAPGGAVVLLR